MLATYVFGKKNNIPFDFIFFHYKIKSHIILTKKDDKIAYEAN